MEPTKPLSEAAALYAMHPKHALDISDDLTKRVASIAEEILPMTSPLPGQVVCIGGLIGRQITVSPTNNTPPRSWLTSLFKKKPLPSAQQTTIIVPPGQLSSTEKQKLLNSRCLTIDGKTYPLNNKRQRIEFAQAEADRFQKIENVGLYFVDADQSRVVIVPFSADQEPDYEKTVSYRIREEHKNPRTGQYDYITNKNRLDIIAKKLTKTSTSFEKTLLDVKQTNRAEILTIETTQRVVEQQTNMLVSLLGYMEAKPLLEAKKQQLEQLLDEKRRFAGTTSANTEMEQLKFELQTHTNLIHQIESKLKQLQDNKKKDPLPLQTFLSGQIASLSSDEPEQQRLEADAVTQKRTLAIDTLFRGWTLDDNDIPRLAKKVLPKSGDASLYVESVEQAAYLHDVGNAAYYLEKFCQWKGKPIYGDSKAIDHIHARLQSIIQEDYPSTYGYVPSDLGDVEPGLRSNPGNPAYEESSSSATSSPETGGGGSVGQTLSHKPISNPSYEESSGYSHLGPRLDGDTSAFDTPNTISPYSHLHDPTHNQVGDNDYLDIAPHNITNSNGLNTESNPLLTTADSGHDHNLRFPPPDTVGSSEPMSNPWLHTGTDLPLGVYGNEEFKPSDGYVEVTDDKDVRETSFSESSLEEFRKSTNFYAGELAHAHVLLNEIFSEFESLSDLSPELSQHIEEFKQESDDALSGNDDWKIQNAYKRLEDLKTEVAKTWQSLLGSPDIDINVAQPLLLLSQLKLCLASSTYASPPAGYPIIVSSFGRYFQKKQYELTEPASVEKQIKLDQMSKEADLLFEYEEKCNNIIELNNELKEGIFHDRLSDWSEELKQKQAEAGFLLGQLFHSYSDRFDVSGLDWNHHLDIQQQLGFKLEQWVPSQIHFHKDGIGFSHPELIWNQELSGFELQEVDWVGELTVPKMESVAPEEDDAASVGSLEDGVESVASMEDDAESVDSFGISPKDARFFEPESEDYEDGLSSY